MHTMFGLPIFPICGILGMLSVCCWEIFQFWMEQLLGLPFYAAILSAVDSTI